MVRLRSWLFIVMTGYLSTTFIAQTVTDLNYSFFVAGHTYGVPEDAGIHPPFRAKFEYIVSRPEIKFGVLAGDMVPANPSVSDWDSVDAHIRMLGLPVYFTMGNHDSENRPLFADRYGDTYYYFFYEKDLFIVLDPNLDAWNITGDQMIFLTNVLSEYATVSENIYVFFHQILWRENDNPFSYISWNSAAGRADSINFWTGIEPLFRTLPNEVFMFAGDLGAPWSTNVVYDHYDNITLIATGMGDSEGDNFIVVNVDSTKSVTFDLICLSDTNMFCLGELTDYWRVDQVVSSADLDLNFPIFLSPNPATDFLSITLPFEESLVQLYDLNGNQVFNQPVTGNRGEFMVGGLPRGMYFTVIRKDSRKWHGRIILH